MTNENVILKNRFNTAKPSIKNKITFEQIYKIEIIICKGWDNTNNNKNERTNIYSYKQTIE